MTEQPDVPAVGTESSAPALPIAPSTRAIRVTCPHCGQELGVVPIGAVQPVPDSAPVQSPLVRAGRSLVDGVMGRLFPHSRSVEQRLSNAADQTRPEPESGRGGRSWIAAGIVLLMLAVALPMLVWGRPGAIVPAPGTALPVATRTPNGTEASVVETAIRDTLTRYLAAETEAAALLQLDPIMPYLAADSPFAARRAAELAERRERNAPHRSILVRWGIGAITVDGDQATVVTQETWSNQEAGAVAPEQATVRVTYTLRWDAATGRWLIVESEQMGL
jgi:hypothetical protein